MKKLFVPAYIAIVSLIPIACQKGISSGESFDVNSVKEWYYSTFRKSPEYLTYDSRTFGKKSPDWRNGKHHKIGGKEIIEFPLIKIKNSVILPSDNELHENKKIAAASLSRIIFVKDNLEKIIVREINYIPDWQYLQSKAFDISQNNISRLDENFSGFVIVKNWDGSEYSRKELINGKVMRSGFVRKADIGNSNKNNRTNTCFLITAYEFVQICTEWWVGDVLIGEDCEDWEPTGNSWEVTMCEEDNGGCGATMSSEECMCYLLGICGDGGGGEDPEECNNALTDLVGSIQDASGPTEVTLELDGQEIRKKDYKWKLAQGGFNTGLAFYSHETGTHKKVNGQWRWDALEHKGISRTGVIIGGSVTCDLNSATPTIGIYNAGLALDVTFTFSLVCQGFPISSTIDKHYERYFNVND